MSGAAARIGIVGLLVSACSGPILANPPLVPVAPPTPTPAPTRPADPVPIELPRDDGPHDRLTEWWYYTGHLSDADGGRWGFEFVVFRAERGGFPTTWASHLALTDEVGGTFRYDQRAAIGADVDQGAAGTEAFALVIRDPAEPVFTSPTAVPSLETGTVLPRTWSLTGSSGDARLAAAMDAGRLGFQLSATTDPTAPPVLHGGAGWIDFGPAGGSYYYSRTRLDVAGGLTIAGRPIEVEGIAWFDHQWGDFISVGGGGWDWFAVNLDDGTDLTISLVRDADGGYPLVYGTLVQPDGGVRDLDAGAFVVEADPGRTWTSPATGATYPAGWTIRIPDEGLVIDLEPTVAAQELDTRATTGVVYWEGSQTVAASRDGTALGGQAYVELTGYAPALP